jgi:hypothetical protein
VLYPSELRGHALIIKGFLLFSVVSSSALLSIVTIFVSSAIRV